MSKPRDDLQFMLESIVGSQHVYFQPPESIKLHYPAVVYVLSNINNTPADNAVYRQETAYQLTVIDEDPDSEISKEISKLSMCRFNRFYTVDNLNHFVYTIYY